MPAVLSRWSGWLAFQLAACAAVGALLVYRPQARPTLLLLTAAALLAPIVIRAFQRSFDPFEPPVMFALAWGVMFVIHPWGMIMNHDITYVSPLRILSLEPTFDRMLFEGLVAAIAFNVAYFLPVGRLLAPTRRRPDAYATDTIILLAIALAAVGLVLFYAFLVTTHISLGTLLQGRSAAVKGSRESATAYLWQGPWLLIPAGVLLLAFGRSRRHRGAFALGLAVAFVLTIRAFALGDRLLILPLFGGLWAFWYIRRGKRPSVPVFLAVVFLAVLGATVVRELRYAEARAQQSTVGTVIQTATTPSDLWGTLTENEDSSEAAAFAGALLFIHDKSYGAATFGDLIARPIPRALWPGKPLPPKQQVVQQMLPREYALGYANPQLSAALPFYMDLGTFGVVIGFGAYGIVSRLVREWFERNRRALHAQVLYALFIPYVIMGLRDGFTDSVERAILILVPVWLIFRTAQRSGRAAEAEAVERHAGSWAALPALRGSGAGGR